MAKSLIRLLNWRGRIDWSIGRLLPHSKAIVPPIAVANGVAESSRQGVTKILSLSLCGSILFALHSVTRKSPADRMVFRRMLTRHLPFSAFAPT